jgi:hypothetical protein
VIESPEMYHSISIQTYISKEVNRPCKQWIHEVLMCRRETERVILRTSEFVLLPDVDSISKRPKMIEGVIEQPMFLPATHNPSSICINAQTGDSSQLLCLTVESSEAALTERNSVDPVSTASPSTASPSTQG